MNDDNNDGAEDDDGLQLHFSSKMQTARLNPKSEQQKLDLHGIFIWHCYLQISLTIRDTDLFTCLLLVSLNK